MKKKTKKKHEFFLREKNSPFFEIKIIKLAISIS
jgi:hypothetical protein